MKKYRVVICLCAGVLGLAGCTVDNPTPSTSTPPASTPATTPAGPQMVTIPDVVGMEAEQAGGALLALSVTAQVTIEPNDQVEAGLVVSVDPTVGASVRVGSQVSMVVSSGPAAAETLAPTTAAT